MRRVAALLLLAAACTRSNAGRISDLEAQAAARPRPDLDAVLARPHGSVPARLPLRTVELDLLDTPLPSVSGEVNGAPIDLLLDTGSTHVTLSGPAAEAARIYLPPGDAVGMVTPGHSATYRECVFESLRLGPIEFGPGVATVAERESRARAPLGGRSRYGIVGGSVLGRFRVTFDFRRRSVRLAPHGRTPGAIALGTRVRIQGSPYWLLVDSGARTIVLEPWAALELGLITEREAARHEKREGAAHAGRWTPLRLRRIEVCGRTFEVVDAAVVNTFDGARLGQGRRAAGLLGLVGLGPLVWTLDYSSSRLTLDG